MADLQYTRSTKVYLEQGSTKWELPVLNGFSFSQTTDDLEITLNEMSDTNGTVRRGRKILKDKFAPAEWSISTYTRPVAHATEGTCVEAALWANFLGSPTYATNSWSTSDHITQSANTIVFDSSASNKGEIGTFDLIFVVGACGAESASYTNTNDVTIYRISGCVANSATIDFDIESITSITWSGMGLKITEEDSFDATSAITSGIDSTDNYVRNRLTSLGVAASDATTFPGAGGGEYNITLTGGSISLENNITFLTPETLCEINQPIGHVTGVKTFGGNFTCYMTRAAGGSQDLFEDLAEADTLVSNSFDLTFSIGGASGPNVVVEFPTAHLEVPTHSFDDIISVDTTFHALPSDFDNSDEVTVTYNA